MATLYCPRPGRRRNHNELTQAASPFEIEPPSRKRLLESIIAAIVGAGVILVAFVLPAEYGIDPTGIGKALGLTAIHGPTRTLQVKDVIGGNENYREVAIPTNPFDPVPLPNPAVSQLKPTSPRTESIEVTLQPNEKTEIKAILDVSQVIVYDWHSEGGEVYTDFHGHEPAAGDAFVRYEEQQSGHEGHGSLVAPFAGEHGWFWLNISETPVTIKLHFTGYHRDIRNYGLIKD
jgi:hypothetical protein